MKINSPILRSIILLSALFLVLPGKAQTNQTSRSILLLIDASGSMQGLKMDSVKSAAKQIITMMLPCNTEFAIMGFTGDKDNAVPFRLDFTTDRTNLFTFIDKLKPWGGTRIGAALKTGSLYLKSHSQINKRSKPIIILLSDGRSDDNVYEAFNELNSRKSVFQTECIGYDLLKDKTAEDQLMFLASKTGGEYYSATDVTNVAKAFFKTTIKTIIREVPVVVRERTDMSFVLNASEKVQKRLTSTNWFLDSIQINASPSTYEMAKMMADDNIQDTLPKSLIFTNAKRVSLFIDKGANSEDEFQKWVDGNFTFVNNTLSISILQYYFKFVIKSIDKRTLVLCLNKFAFLSKDMKEPDDVYCDCTNKVPRDYPYIVIYFSKAGCE
ncbi:MAG TPA: vWA domain-containing protein [Bacteroidales bacterium]|nr:vWA domain-containing protein [Bacteroidales bacterium]